MTAIRRLDRTLRPDGWRCDLRFKTYPMPAGDAACAAQRNTFSRKPEMIYNQKLLFCRSGIAHFVQLTPADVQGMGRHETRKNTYHPTPIADRRAGPAAGHA
jgi:hypothetical protein